MSRTKWIIIVLVLVVIAVQFFRPPITNPPVNPQHTIVALMAVPPEVQSVLQRACYDCHSSNTRLPWYRHVAPFSWLLASDINEGREDLSFSEFATYSRKKAARKLQQTCDEVKDGGMPPWYYTPMHPESKLSATDKQMICAWATAARQRIVAPR